MPMQSEPKARSRTEPESAPTPSADVPTLLDIQDVTIAYGRGGRQKKVLESVSFDVRRGETLGLVGESGSGKTTLARAVLGQAQVTAGRIIFDGDDITNMRRGQRRPLSRRIQAIFQNPYLALNPQRTIAQSVGETLTTSGLPADVRRARVLEMLEMVGIARADADRYPGSFSGGQRQRIAIARALVPRPDLVICDEAVSALDLSIQAQVLNLLVDLQDELGLAYLFITHDLAVVRHLCHRIAVVRRGELVEKGDAASVCAQPAHPYTQQLIAAAL